jgi:Tol biopolymer transport system component
MSALDRFELGLPDRLEDLAAPRVPSYYDNVIRTTARTRQRPGWTFAERWLPMSTFTDRMVTVPRAPVRALAVVAILVLALAALLVLAVGSRQPRVPPPFGPAENGRIVWVDAAGSIVAADADGSNEVTLVVGPSLDRPMFSPDGIRLLYLRDAPAGTELIVSDADGANPVTIASGLPAVGAVWGPDSRSIVIAREGTLSRLEAKAGAEPVVIAEGADDGFDWNVEPSKLFRPPAGEEIAWIRGAGADMAIVIANADGSSPREILTPVTAGFPYFGLGNLRWSPDGTRLSFVATLSGDGAATRVYLLDAGGGTPRRLTHSEPTGVIIGENNPQWSPDSTRILLQVWRMAGDATDVRPLTVVDVASGDEREIGSASLDGFASFGWSPDGRSVLSVDDSGTVRVLDAESGLAGAPWTAESGASWQRVRP